MVAPETIVVGVDGGTPTVENLQGFLKYYRSCRFPGSRPGPYFVTYLLGDGMHVELDLLEGEIPEPQSSSELPLTLAEFFDSVEQHKTCDRFLRCIVITRRKAVLPSAHPLLSNQDFYCDFLVPDDILAEIDVSGLATNSYLVTESNLVRSFNLLLAHPRLRNKDYSTWLHVGSPASSPVSQS
eukprot:Sspe_Gene.54961::Locus_30282_Transcript_1_1_Confidence_1.000_Length_745::g.54961::m.54961